MSQPLSAIAVLEHEPARSKWRRLTLAAMWKGGW